VKPEPSSSSSGASRADSPLVLLLWRRAASLLAQVPAWTPPAVADAVIRPYASRLRLPISTAATSLPELPRPPGRARPGSPSLRRRPRRDRLRDL